jgi:radical SAM enzyme (TIGR01210 family)
MSSALDAWILSHRPVREKRDPYLPYEYFVEEECSARGSVETVATIFLTNRECPFRCLMCDLWRNTLTETVGVGAIPAQIDHALSQLPPARVLKLYNSGSFFDPHAIPVEDYAEIASRVMPFERVIVESHPALVGERPVQFRDLLQARLEVAMGLETVHPEILPRLNKRMTLGQFADAAGFLRDRAMDLRVFVLVKPPFLREDEALEWAARSLDFAFECGATAVTLIPTRGGNGAMEDLALNAEFSPPRLATLENALEYGLGLRRGRVFLDLWGMHQGISCPLCYHQRVARLRSMNLRQTVLPPAMCGACG